MEENSKSNVTFNIYGGNNQILPNATEAVQNFYGDQFADQKLHSEGESTDAPNEDEQRLAIYINKVKSLRGYISLLTACKKAKEVGGGSSHDVPERGGDRCRPYRQERFHPSPPSIPHECEDRQGSR